MPEEQAAGAHFEIVPLWMRVALGALFAFVAISALLKNGLRNWDWLRYIAPPGE
jgi:hypothetical protein